ncbi:DUF2330 domain-containing protein, partial [Oscillatoria salina]|uniref:DUF2330 domain-containing protein n=1 Tax=Oscillatoria salina TaxID=331517 RepID=UPI001CCE9D1B
MKIWRVLATVILTLFLTISFVLPAEAFCGFYVAKADTNLYNQASQVIIAKDGARTILTMANDYKGEVKNFALVVPVPVVLDEEQVRIGETKIIQRLDAFSAPRLVEYFDENPCQIRDRGFVLESAPAPAAGAPRARREDESLGVTVEA